MNRRNLKILTWICTTAAALIYAIGFAATIQPSQEEEHLKQKLHWYETNETTAIMKGLAERYQKLWQQDQNPSEKKYIFKELNEIRNTLESQRQPYIEKLTNARDERIQQVHQNNRLANSFALAGLAGVVLLFITAPKKS